MKNTQPNTAQNKPMTREEWLNAGLNALRPWFEAKAKVRIPEDTRVSVGFPGGGSARKRIGECWARKVSKDNVNEIFINPTLSDPVQMLDVLAHEAIHAIDDCVSGHKGEFKRIAKDIGLEGKMTSTHAGEELRAELERIVGVLPGLSHGALDLSGRKKQPTRLVKLECDCCGMIIRTTQKWVEQTGLPSCACSGNFYCA